MKHGKIFKRVYLMLTSLLIMMAFIAISCANNTNESADDPGYNITFDDSGNKIITVEKGIGHFSMEYPSEFELGLIKIDNSGGIKSLFVDFLGPVTPNIQTLISVSIADYETLTAVDVAESSLSDARNYTNFKLIDESIITVAGETAYQHSYYFDTWPYDEHYVPMKKDSPLVTWLNREVFFDRNGLLWTLRLGTDPSREEQDMAAFDRVLETFKVLD